MHILPQDAPELLHLSVKFEIFLGGLAPPTPPPQTERLASLGTRRAARGTATRGGKRSLFFFYQLASMIFQLHVSDSKASESLIFKDCINKN